MGVYPRNPTMDVIGFLYAIGGQFTAALAMAARIGKQHRIAMFQQQASVSRHAFTIVSDSMQQNYRIAVVVAWMDKPALERHSVSGSDRHILQFSAEISSHSCGNGLLMPQRKSMELEADIGYGDAGQNRQNNIGYEACKQGFAQDVRSFRRWFRVRRRIHDLSDESDLILETFAAEANYSLPRRI